MKSCEEGPLSSCCLLCLKYKERAPLLLKFLFERETCFSYAKCKIFLLTSTYPAVAHLLYLGKTDIGFI